MFQGMLEFSRRNLEFEPNGCFFGFRRHAAPEIFSHQKNTLVLGCFRITKTRPSKVVTIQLHSLKLTYLGGGFKYVLFSSLFGEMIQFD